MKKFLLFLLAIFYIQVAFSMSIKNIQNEQTEFFSLISSQVKIETQSNTTNLKINYDLLGDLKEKNLTFSNCGYLNCLQFDLVDLMQLQNNSFLSSNIFNLTLDNITKTIYLDIEKPNMTLISSNINNSLKKLNLNFSFNDDLSGIKKIDLFEKSNGNLLFISTLTNKTNYNLNLSKDGNLTLLFKIEDKAGNKNDVEHNFQINDIFLPEINYLFLEKKENQFLLNFKIKDNNLKNYRIGQNNIYLSEDISGNEFEKQIIIPFNSGIVNFEVEDISGNKIIENIDLDINIEVKNLNSFINSGIFTFTSNANLCVLTKLNNDFKNNSFNKNSNTFTLNLGISSNREYEIEFFCQSNFFREYYTHKFILDSKKPTKSDLNFKARDNGDVYLNWTQSTDENSFVEYKLYKNGNSIYTGDKLNYLDSQVSYPDEFTYYLEVSDKAGNTQKSDTIKVIPKKDSVSLNLLLPKTLTQYDKNYSLFISTDIFADVIIIITNNNTKIFEKEFLKVTTKDFEVELDLELGVNKIEVKVKDEFNNTNSKISSIIVEEKQIEQVNQNIQTSNIQENKYLDLIKQKEEELELQLQQASIIQKEENSGIFNWWGLILLILILFLILALFVHNHPVLREKVIQKIRKTTHFYEKSRKHDMILGKSLQKAKEQRIKKQQIAKEKELKAKKEEKKSEYHSKKLEELSKRRQVVIPHEIRKKAAKKHKKTHNELTNEENLENSRKQIEKKSIFSFFKFKKEEKQIDDFHKYLLSDNVKRRWDSTNSYRVKKEEPKDLPDTNLEKKQELPKQELPKQESKTKIDPFKKNQSQLNQIQKETKEQRKSLFSIFKKNIDNSKKIQDLKEEEKPQEEKPTKNKNEVLSSLDEYLGKRTKKKRRYFAEKAVEEDLRRRKI